MSLTVLKLDVSLRPLGLIPWHEAIRLLYLGKATVLEESPDEFWCSPSVQIPKPLVIMTHHYVKLSHKGNRGMPTKVLLYARDGGKCAYCRKPLSLRAATVDHVVPKSRGASLGLSKDQIGDWTNVTTACSPCNHVKADKMPWECGMYPATTPKKPLYVPSFVHGKLIPMHRQYVEYFYELPDDPNEPATEHPA